jgi:hypothetical protein
MRAVLIYQHATTDRDRSIADTLSALVDLDRTQGITAESKEDGDDGLHRRRGAQLDPVLVVEVGGVDVHLLAGRVPARSPSTAGGL